MPKRKEPEKFAQLGNKSCWHPYSLQVLSPAKFTLVVGEILRGKYELVRTKNDKRVFTEVYH